MDTTLGLKHLTKDMHDLLLIIRDGIRSKKGNSNDTFSKFILQYMSSEKAFFVLIRLLIIMVCSLVTFIKMMML